MKETEKYKAAVHIFRAFDIRLEINAPVEEVFDRLTTADGLNSWWTDATEAEPREGGKIKFVWKNNGSPFIAKAVYLRFERPELIEIEYIEWESPADANQLSPYPPPVIHEFELEENLEGNTLILLKTSGMYTDKEFDKIFEETRQGWINSLANLKSVCETAVDLRS